MRRLRDPYALAAVVYLAYGLVYLGGAVAALTPERQVTFFGFVPWWAFYVVGLGLVMTLPALVWRRFKWLTRFISVAVRAFACEFTPAVRPATRSVTAPPAIGASQLHENAKVAVQIRVGAVEVEVANG